MFQLLIAVILCFFISPVLGQEKPRAAADMSLRPFSISSMTPPAAQVDLRAVFDSLRGQQLPPVRIKDGHFVAGGERVRFWGVNLCFSACFPTHDAADRLAATLAAYGVNCVRLHHMDMMAFPRGIWSKDFNGFDNEAMDRLDYLLAAFKREGVYVNMNLHVTRDFTKTGSQYKTDDMPSAGKQVCIIEPSLVELQKQYARDLLGRVNKYTKVRYADDPVIALVEISNENSIFLSLSKFSRNELPGRFEELLVQGWNRFLLDKYGDRAALVAAWADDTQGLKTQLLSWPKDNIDRLRRADISPGRRSEDYVEFLTKVDMDFFVGMRNFLREELGVRCPITGTEGFTLPSDYVQSHLDYVDSHEYWQHPHFEGGAWDPANWTIPNTAMVDEPTASTLLRLTFQRMLSPDGSGEPVPFTVSEYNHCAPNDYQAEGIPMVSAFAAAQDWDGVFLFAYKHNDRWDQDYVGSYFDIHANPVKMAQLMAGALLFRRGDIKPLGHQVVTHIPPRSMYELGARHLPWTDEIQKSTALDAPAAKRFYGRYAIAPYPSPSETGSSTVMIPEVNGTPWAKGDSGVRMVTSESTLSWTANGPNTGWFFADGDLGKAWVGFSADEAGADHEGFSVSLETPQFAAVTLSALDGKPLDRSSRVLITACSRTENTGQIWNEARTSVGKKWGRGPTLIEPVVAEVRLPHLAAKAVLTALGGDGKPLQKWTLDSTDGAFALPLGRGPTTLWYILECE